MDFDKLREGMSKAVAKQELQDEFTGFDYSRLRKMPDQELAAWQANYPMDSPQFIIASQEWNNRSLSKQLRWVKISAIVTPLATLIAGILGAIAIYMQTMHQPQMPPIHSTEGLHRSPSAPIHPIPSPPTK